MTHFEIIGPITHIEKIAVGHGIRILPLLRKQYGHGTWRKLKGIANVKLRDGAIRRAEVHWFEALWYREKENANKTIFGLTGYTMPYEHSICDLHQK